MEVDNGQLLQTLNPIRMPEFALESLNATLVSSMPADILKMPEIQVFDLGQRPIVHEGWLYHGTGEASCGMRYPGVRLNAGTASPIQINGS